MPPPFRESRGGSSVRIPLGRRERDRRFRLWHPHRHTLGNPDERHHKFVCVTDRARKTCFLDRDGGGSTFCVICFTLENVCSLYLDFQTGCHVREFERTAVNHPAANTHHRGDIFSISHRGGVGFDPSDSHLKTGIIVASQVEMLLRIFHVIVVPSSESVAASAGAIHPSVGTHRFTGNPFQLIVTRPFRPCM